MAEDRWLTIPEFNGTLRLNKPIDKLQVGDLASGLSVVLDTQDGVVSLGPGHTALNASALGETELNGISRRGTIRYQTAGVKAYRDFIELRSDLNGKQVSHVNYNDGRGNEWSYFVGGGKQFKDDGNIMRDMGSAAPTAKPTVALSTGTHSLTTVNYVYTYKNSSTGYETNSSPVSDDLSPSTEGILLTAIQPSTDPQIDKIRIYRKDSTLGTHYFAQEINNGIATWDDTGTVANTDLGDNVETDNTLIGSELILAGPLFNRLFAAGATSNLLTWSKPYALGKGRAEQWPALNNVEVGPLDSGIVDLIIAYGGLLLPSQDRWHGLAGSTSSTFFATPLRIDRGLASRSAWAIVPAGILYLGRDGLYVTDGTRAQQVYDSLRPLFQGQTINGIPPLNETQISRCRMATYKQFVYFSYPAVGSDPPNRVLRLHKTKEQATLLPWSANAMFFEHQDNLLVFGDNLGVVHKESGFDLNGSDQSVSLESTAMRDVEDPLTFLRIKRPRTFVLGIDTGGVNFVLSLLIDGASQVTKTINTSSRSIVTMDATNAARGIRVQFKLTATTSTEFALYGAALLYEPAGVKFG